ncbi:MAG TPA: hypothetical protein VHH34_17870 [Pseudonocardiaceae bacterium]|nr:hypothetical protein [Pseudonocardiaceae bacterium]
MLTTQDATAQVTSAQAGSAGQPTADYAVLAGDILRAIAHAQQITGGSAGGLPAQ